MNVIAIEQLTSLSLLVIFLFGITCGVVGGAVYGSRRGALVVPTSDDLLSAGAPGDLRGLPPRLRRSPAEPPLGQQAGARRSARGRGPGIARSGAGPMRSFEIVAIVIGIFFAIGIVVGMLLVITLPLLRALLRGRRNRRRHIDGGNWWKSHPGDDDRRPPPWPGG